jgi:hypothetical protein
MTPAGRLGVVTQLKKFRKVQDLQNVPNFFKSPKFSKTYKFSKRLKFSKSSRLKKNSRFLKKVPAQKRFRKDQIETNTSPLLLLMLLLPLSAYCYWN